jgi:hypothetical protein
MRRFFSGLSVVVALLCAVMLTACGPLITPPEIAELTGNAIIGGGGSGSGGTEPEGPVAVLYVDGDTSPDPDGNWTYDAALKCFTIANGARIIATNKDPTRAAANALKVASGDKITKITLNNVYISSGTYDAIDLNGTKTVLTLEGNNTLYPRNGGSNYGDTFAGINVTIPAELTINAADDNQSLTVRGGYKAAAIGGRHAGNTGKITFNGGTVNATGGWTASAIGGGCNPANQGTIIINGGVINAVGGDYAAGIGGGEEQFTFVANKDRDPKITINGGVVVARGQYLSAGIGGGAHGAAGTITINGGDVKAYGGLDAPGIGSGGGDGGLPIGASGEITITGGNVYAVGSAKAAGIGAGATYEFDFNPGSGGIITITGGTVAVSPSWASRRGVRGIISVTGGATVTPAP